MDSRLTGMKIALLQGGPGSERAVSLKSAESVRAALAAAGAQVSDVDVHGVEVRLPEGTDLAFNVIHGTFGEDGALQEALDRLGVPYTGAGAASSRAAFDKILSKEAFAAAGVPTPAAQVLDLTARSPAQPAAGLDLPLPVVLKPPREGSSVGIHIVRDAAGVAPALEDLRRFGNDALAEAFVEGKELTVGVLDGQALPVVHIRPRSGFYDMNNKYPWLGGGGGSDYLCPADLDPDATRQVQKAALAAHRALGTEVYSRVDVLLDHDGAPWVLEVNTIPGMTESSLLPKSAAAAGIDFLGLCSKIAELSLKLRKSE